MKQAVAVIALIVAAAGCASSMPAEAPIPAVPAGHRPRTAIIGARTEDGRPIVYGDKSWWCYSNPSREDDGDCAEQLDACTVIRSKRIMWEFGELISRVPDQKAAYEGRMEYLRIVEKDWTPCAPRNAFACFYGSEVVSGEKYNLCFPTLETCDRKLNNQRTISDYRPGVDRCLVYRRRSPAEH